MGKRVPLWKQLSNLRGDQFETETDLYYRTLQRFYSDRSGARPVYWDIFRSFMTPELDNVVGNAGIVYTTLETLFKDPL